MNEYSTCADIKLEPILPQAFSLLNEDTNTRIQDIDLSHNLSIPYTATTPNLLARFIFIKKDETLTISSNATSHLFYVIDGAGWSEDFEFGKGDIFVQCGEIKLKSITDTKIYSVNDEPLLNFLGVSPNEKKFHPTLFKKNDLYQKLNEIIHTTNHETSNRLGILLSNRHTESNTRTITHTLWCLLNYIPAGRKQPPHRHNSVALDLCVSGGSDKVYTLMGLELGDDGWIKNPTKVYWKNDGMFITPPGWWHSHHNESNEDAIVLPIQDAGLYTYQRTLDIQFSKIK